MSELRERLQETLGAAYRLDRELPGGMSRVFVAEEIALARRVVIKVLPPETAASVNMGRFRREIQLAASLQHPHIVPLLTAGSRGDLLWYVMPLVEGESLRTRLLRSGELPVNDVVSIIRDAASALAYAHDRGVVHRDIKPDNILLTGRFALVTDFGVAKAVSEATSDSNLTSVGVALGTPTYMAPEQAAADPNTDHRADIYALGTVAYEMLTGRPPFTGTSPQMILAAHVTKSPDAVTQHRASVPPALAAIVMRCMEKKPADRWQSAEELVQQLAFVAASGGTPPTAPYAAPTAFPARSLPSRRAALAGAFALGLAAFGVFAFLNNRDERPQFHMRRVVVSDFENQTRDQSLDPVGRLAADLMRQGIAQTGVAEVVSAAETRKSYSAGDKASESQQLTTGTRPGLILRGSYYREGDSLRFQAEIVEASGARVIRTLSPVTASVTNPAAALERMRTRVMGAVATLNDPLLYAWARAATQPPVYEAYRAYRAGIDAEIPRTGTAATRVTEPEVYVTRALELDSTFVPAAVGVFVSTQGTASNRLDIKQLMYLERIRDKLSPVDRALVDHARAAAVDDWASAYRSARAAAEIAPDPAMLIHFAQYAIYASRPREALRALDRADPHRNLKHGWGERTDALHLTNDLTSELKAIERMRELEIEAEYDEVQVYAALGRTAEVNARVNARMRRPPRAEENAASLMMFGAREYRAHGFLEASNQLAERAISWYESRPDLELTRERKLNILDALVHAGRFHAARLMVEQLAPELDRAHAAGLLGLIAAHVGERERAEALSEELRRLPSTAPGGSAYPRALIAARLGQKEKAVALLQQAFAEGRYFEPYLHREIPFQMIQDYPPMRELLWPKQ